MKRLISSSLVLFLIVAAMVVWLSDSLNGSHAASPAALPDGPFPTLPPALPFQVMRNVQQESNAVPGNHGPRTLQPIRQMCMLRGTGCMGAI
jgi:hypothetical protein